MNEQQKQRALQILRRFEQANPMTRPADNAAVDMAALLQELIAEQPIAKPYLLTWKPGEGGGEITDANGDEYYLKNPNAVAMARDILSEQPASVPVLTVECEPDYWSGGHYHEGTKPYIAPENVWGLPIGTKLYTAPAASERDPELARDAERYRWLRVYNTAKHPVVTEAFFVGDENLDNAVDAAIAAEKGGA